MYVTCLLVTKTFQMSKHVVHELFLWKHYQLCNINSINTCFRVVQVLFHFFFISWGNAINIKISTTKLPLRHVSTIVFSAIYVPLIEYHRGICSARMVPISQSAHPLILQNWFLSEFFFSIYIEGADRVTPISPYIFILCAEVLSIMLKTEDSIKGISINNSYTLCQYADDTHFCLDGSERSLSSTLRILHMFYLMSGFTL